MMSATLDRYLEAIFNYLVDHNVWTTRWCTAKAVVKITYVIIFVCQC